MADLGKET
jgi:molecular chaperone GrpE